MNLLNAIELLKNEIQGKESLAETEIKKHEHAIEQINKQIMAETSPLKIALKQLKESNTVCEYCKGTGQERYTDVMGDRDTKKCAMCEGTGKAVLYPIVASKWGNY